MKKLLLTALVMLSGLAIVRAGGPLYNSPRGDNQALATADYGGYNVSTAAFSAAYTTACIPCNGVFGGVVFSSGNLASYDWVDVFDSSTTLSANATLTPMVRLYNVNGSTLSANNGASTVASASGWSGTPKPLRFNKGLIFKASVAVYNIIDCLWWGMPETPQTSYYQGQ